MSAGGTPLQAGATPTGSRGTVALRPDAGPSWLRPLVDNVGQIPDAYRRRLPADVLAMVTAAGAVSAMTSSRRDHREAAGRRSRAQGSTRRQVAVTDADSPVADGFSAPGPDTDAGDIPGRDGCPRVDRPAARRSARGPAGTDRPVLRSWRPVVGAGWGSRAIVADGAGKEAEGRRNQTVRVGGDQSAHRSVGGRRGRGAHARKAAPDGPLGDLVAAGWHRGGPDGPARVDLTGGPMTAIGMSHPPRVHRRVGGQRTALTAGIGLLLAALVLTTIANPPAAFAHTAQLSTATPAPAVAATDANDVPTWPFVVGTVAAVAVAALWAVRRGR